MIKLYVFTEQDSDEIIEQVRAEDHDQAVAAAQNPRVNSNTDFYSTDAA